MKKKKTEFCHPTDLTVISIMYEYERRSCEKCILSLHNGLQFCFPNIL